MKLQTKILLIFILFLIFTLWNNETFAYSLISSGSMSISYNGEANLTDYISYISTNSTYWDESSYYLSFNWPSTGITHCFVTDSPMFIKKYSGGYHIYSKTSNYSQFSGFTKGKKPSYNYFSSDDKQKNMTSHVFLLNIGSNYEIEDIDNLQSNHEIKYLGTEDVAIGSTLKPDVDKLNLFELNLTDLDYNNQVHQFNLSTYTNSECYDEIMECYNNNYQYSIYTTKYQRILTYDDENNMNLQHGSYMLSGYIDFLVTDEAYFYFSPYYNKVLSNSGTKIFNKEVSDYTKRFYYKLVYSEDSDGYGFEIWQDNGSLILGDIYSTPDSCVFIGSSQTIYYANENSKHKIKDLSTNRYYTGYNSSSEDNPRSVSYAYNFGFSGGTTTKLFLNSSTYNDDLDKVNYLLDVSYSDRDSFSVQDYNDDNNSVTGLDYSTTTFDQEDNVTDDTFNEEDDSYFGEERSFVYNDEENTSNWSILDFLRGIYNALTGKEDTSSTSSSISDSVNTIQDKFSFTNNIVQNAQDIKDYIINTQETHKYYITINHKYLSGEVCIIDLSWYEPYKPTVDSLICAFAYLAFIWRMFCNIPNLISGSSITSYSSDINAYKNTGFGRSGNIHKGGF